MDDRLTGAYAERRCVFGVTPTSHRESGRRPRSPRWPPPSKPAPNLSGWQFTLPRGASSDGARSWDSNVVTLTSCTPRSRSPVLGYRSVTDRSRSTVRRTRRSAGIPNVEKRGGWPSVVDAKQTAVSHPPRSSNLCPAPGTNSSALSSSSVGNAGYRRGSGTSVWTRGSVFELLRQRLSTRLHTHCRLPPGGGQLRGRSPSR
jgi:hypothetical protein